MQLGFCIFGLQLFSPFWFRVCCKLNTLKSPTNYMLIKQKLAESILFGSIGFVGLYAHLEGYLFCIHQKDFGQPDSPSGSYLDLSFRFYVTEIRFCSRFSFLASIFVCRIYVWLCINFDFWRCRSEFFINIYPRCHASTRKSCYTARFGQSTLPLSFIPTFLDIPPPTFLEFNPSTTTTFLWPRPHH